jgi:hypothetical protein
MARYATAAAILLAAGFIHASPAQAQATRTWVSGVGDDVNPCSRTAPCKTFAGAISKTAANGEINCLDPGGFGAITITKSITIDCTGTNGSILAANFNGVTVNGAGIVVTLRKLVINGAGTTIGNGVRIVNAGSVNIDHVVMENFGGTGTNGRGIAIETSAANVRVSVTNSSIHNANNHGIHSNPSAGNVLLSVDRTDISRGGASGVLLRISTLASITKSLITLHTAGAGVTIEGNGIAALIGETVITQNATGLINGVAGGNPHSRIYGSTITQNTVNGIVQGGGIVDSFGNNAFSGNVGLVQISNNIGTQ